MTGTTGRVFEGAYVSLEYVPAGSDEVNVESGVTPVTIIIVPLNGLSPFILSAAKNDPSSAWRTIIGKTRAYRAMTIPAMMRLETTGVNWVSEEKRVRMIITTMTLRRATVNGIEADGGMLSLSMIEPSPEEIEELTCVSPTTQRSLMR